jgi:MoxR-like ATPase
MAENGFRLYAGDGSTVEQRGTRLPLFEPVAALDDPVNYIAGKGLADAVNVALTLGQPLFVTGEPGTGKTQLAGSVAHELNLPPPLVFHTKTTSTARDLFYRYDSLRHFHDAQFRREELPAENYITYEALGLAILLSMRPEEADPVLPEGLRGRGPVRSVVLVDEIDKAPRDLPNDILNEIENLSFEVRETGRTFSADQGYRPILILTSNSEKNLPDAFLRRCVFYHIAFPEGERLKEIVQRRLRLIPDFTPRMLEHALEHFEQIRELALKKRPATAELLAWVRILERMQLDVGDLKPGEAESLALTYSVLAKSVEDRELMARAMRPES